MPKAKIKELTVENAPLVGNIAEYLDEQELDRIGAQCVSDYVDDENSRGGWVDRYVKALEVAAQVWKKKTYPWPNAANVKYPTLTIACLQFHARAYPALIPSEGIVTGKWYGRDQDNQKRDALERVVRYQNYQIYEEIPAWEEGMDRLLICLPLTGSEFKKVYKDNDDNVLKSEHIFAKDLVVNYHATDLKTAARVTQICELNKNDLLVAMEDELYLDRPIGEPIARNDAVTQVRDKAQGRSPIGKLDDASNYMILEQHCWIDLDGDGYREPYIVTVERQSEKVLRIEARWRAGNIKVTKKGRVKKITPDEYFIHYKFIPSIDGGFYGMGFGQLIGSLNGAINTSINQLLDAGTIRNLGGGFITRNFRLRGGTLEFDPGKWRIVNASGQDIRQGLLPLPTNEPSPVLFQLLELLIRVSQQLTSTTEIMVGENPGQNQKATTTLAVVQNGMKVFTAIYKRIRRTMGEEFKLIYGLNAQYLDATHYYTLLGERGSVEEFNVLPTDFSLGLDIVPSADPNAFSTMEKLAKLQVAGEMIQLGTINPLVYTQRLLEGAEVDRWQELVQDPSSMGPSVDEQKLQIEAQKVQNDDENKKTELLIKAHEVGLKAQEMKQKGAIEHMKAVTTVLKGHLDIQKAEVDVKKAEAQAKKAKEKPSAGGKSSSK